MGIKKVFVAGKYELLLIPDDEFESNCLLYFGRVGDSLKGELKKDPSYQYPHIVLRKE